MKTEFELRLTLEEGNLILEALGQMPFARVFELVRKIQSEARRQLEEPDEETATDGE